MDKHFKEIPLCLLTETPLGDLDSSTDSAFPNRADKINNVRITNKTYQKLDDNKLLVKARCAGESNDYDTQVLFDGVQFVDGGNSESITLNGGFNILPLSEDKNDVKVSCTCLDFHWTFAWQNSGDGSLLGDPPPPYQRKTNREPRNPTNAIGLCKHLLKLNADMKAEGLLN